MNWHKERKIIIALTSITYAAKAKKLLNSYGYFCKITKTPKDLSKGCGYSIIIKDDLYTILKVLESENIKVKDYTNVGSI